MHYQVHENTFNDLKRCTESLESIINLLAENSGNIQVDKFVSLLETITTKQAALLPCFEWERNELKEELENSNVYQILY